MADYDNRVLRAPTAAAGVIDAGLRAYMLRVYNYMLVGLALTGATAWATAETPFGQLFYRVNPLTGAIESDAETLEAIVTETVATITRQQNAADARRNPRRQDGQRTDDQGLRLRRQVRELVLQHLT